MKNGMFLDWTMLNACLKDQQVFQCIDMKSCDNEETIIDRYYGFST